MIQKEMNAENKEIMGKAYELYEEHGFQDGNDFIDWLEAEKQSGQRSRLKRYKQMRGGFFAILGVLCVIVAILLIMLLRARPQVTLSPNSLSDLKVMVLVLDPKNDEKVILLGDTYFDFDQAILTVDAKRQLDQDVLVLNENPSVHVRMAGYTSGQGSEEVNQLLSEKRANTVRDYLIEKGISSERITVIGYGRTKPAVYEVSPGDIHSKEAKANMRVLFEVVVE